MVSLLLIAAFAFALLVTALLAICEMFLLYCTDDVLNISFICSPKLKDKSRGLIVGSKAQPHKPCTIVMRLPSKALRLVLREGRPMLLGRA